MKYISLFTALSLLTCALLVLCIYGTQAGQGATEPLNSAVCADIQARFDKVRAGATGGCKKNADCGCYNPVSKKSGCGGVTDRATADQLSELEKEFHRARCRWPVHCAPWICNPVCANGRCIKGSRHRL